MSLLSLKNVTKLYGGKLALDNVSLELEQGKIIGLLGPNGSGKTTLIKLVNGLLTPNFGEILINGVAPCDITKAQVSYLPERTYLNDWMKVIDILRMFEDFYEDFSYETAVEMLKRLDIDPSDRLKTMSKGTKEKVQLILVMSRNARLYLLDEPIAGVDPAARDYILDTIITNYRPTSSVIICTHLISDIEKVLDEVVFISQGKFFLHESANSIRQNKGMSVDEYFREVFRC